MKKTKININLNTIIFIVILLILGFGGGFTWMGNVLSNTKDKLNEQTNLATALQSELVETNNANNELVTTKKTLQTSIVTLSNENLNLTKTQKELLSRIKMQKKEHTIISAVLSKTQARLDSALFYDTVVEINENDSSLTFIETNDSICFDITINHALQALLLKKPTIKFNSLVINNEQYLEFHWDNDNEYNKKPVSVSIINSNRLIHIVGIDSYMIPEVNKKALKPTGWEKVGIFFKNSKGELIIGGVAAVVGFGLGAAAF